MSQIEPARASLRREVVVHSVIATSIGAVAVVAALAVFDRWSGASASIWYLTLNGLSAIGFGSLIWREVRAAVRAFRAVRRLEHH